MVLDECLAHPSDVAAARRRWSARSAGRGARASDSSRSERAAAVPGRSLRPNPGRRSSGSSRAACIRSCARRARAQTVAMGFEAYAIGGLSVGEPTDVMYESCRARRPCLPEDRPRYLMGAGTPEDLVEAVARGVDLFDCVLPTRNARNGQLFTSEGRINIKNARYAEDDRPPDPDCGCYTCRTCSRAYLRHLFQAGEINASTLNTLHNLHFYLDTLRRIRDAIAFGRFESFRLAFRRTLLQSEPRSEFVIDVHDSVFAMAAPPRRKRPWLQFVPFVLVLAIFYFIILLPMKKKQQKVQEFLGSAEGRRPRHHDRRHPRADHAAGRQDRAAADRRQGADRSGQGVHRRLSGAGSGRRTGQISRAGHP